MNWANVPTLLSCLIVSCCFEFSTWGQESHRPNIIFAIADDWGWPHAGMYGDQSVATPTFDQLARDGVLFEHAFVSSPSCTPSRAAILTGQYHWRLKESANLHSTLRTEFETYPELLQQNGYFVGLQGKGWGPGRIDVGGRKQNPAGPKFADFETFLRQRPQGKPFCFWFGSSDPHRPYQVGSGKAAGMDVDKISVPPFYPNVETVRSDIADYYLEVQRFDNDVQRILRQLQETGEADNTIVVMTGDHGMPFPRCKGNLYDMGARVPLVIRWPQKIPGNRRIQDFVSLTDLAPTFLAAAGIDVPQTMTGRSLLPALTSDQSGWVDRERTFVLMGKERHVPCQEAPNSGGTPMRAIRNREYLLIHNFAPERWPAGTPHYQQAFFPGSWLGDADNGLTKSWLVDHQHDSSQDRKWYELSFAKRPEFELYDIGKDPFQVNNVAGSPEYAETLQQLRAELHQRLLATADARAQGNGDQFDQYPYYGGSPLHPDFKAD